MNTKTREHVRYLLAVACELHVDGQMYVANTKDLSTGGAAVVCRAKLTTGKVVSVTLFLTQDGIEDANQPPVTLSASIQWTEPREHGQSIAGMQFISPTPSQKDALTLFLKGVDTF